MLDVVYLFLLGARWKVKYVDRGNKTKVPQVLCQCMDDVVVFDMQ